MTIPLCLCLIYSRLSQSQSQSQSQFRLSLIPAYSHSLLKNHLYFHLSSSSYSSFPSSFPSSSSSPSSTTDPPSSSTTHPPLLSASIASLHNAALVHLHRGLAIHAHHIHPCPTPPHHHPEPFLSAIVNGFSQIVRLQTGLERAQPRHVILSLLAIVRARLAHPNSSPPDWHSALPLILHAALRPSLDPVGDWAWDELRRANYSRLTHLSSNLLSLHLPSLPLNPRLFSALVVLAALRNEGPSLAHIVNSLVSRISSTIPPDLDLTGLPNPSRARYFLRAVELALLWRRPPDNRPSSSSFELQDSPLAPSESSSQDSRMVHLLRRAFHARRADSLDFCIDTAKRITEAVDGSDVESGWLAIDWREPGRPGEPLEPPPTSVTPMALTKPVLGVLLGGFAAQGMLGRVDELIGLARRCGGMSRYLWMALLHGLATGTRAEMVGTYMARMAAEDGLRTDVEADCLNVSAQVARDLAGAEPALARLLQQNPSLPASALNTVVHALLRVGELARAEALLAHMAPNATTLNHFLHHHASQTRPNLSALLAHLRRFESLGVRPDVVSFTTMLNVLLKLGVGEGMVMGLLEMMEEMGIEANGVTYGAIVHHLCRSGRQSDVGLALGLVDGIERRGVATTEITYTALIQGFLRVHVATHRYPGESTEALVTATKLVGRLRGRGQGANQVVYNALLNGLLSTGHIESGLAVFEQMRAERSKVEMDRRGSGIVDSYGIVLRRLGERGEVDKVKEVVKLLKRENLERWPGWVIRIVERIEG